MNSKIPIAILIFILLGLLGYMLSQTIWGEGASPADNNGTLVTVYKSPSCGCCGAWATYIEKEGYNVTTENVQNMSDVKKRLGVPYELESCHTAEIEGYVVEGHIPHEAIEKLLVEKPNIKGIGMAGMPSGSPGMPGPKNEAFVVYEITHEGMRGDIFVTL